MRCGGVDFPDLPRGIGQIGVTQMQCHVILFGLREESAKPQRLFKKRERNIERRLPIVDPKRDLPAAQARTDVIVACLLYTSPSPRD